MSTSINNIKNFSALLQSYGVEIPLIQRDYVQGRVHNTEKYEGKGDETSKKMLKKYISEREKRDNFVAQLISALDAPHNNPMQLTFIYGTTVETGTNSMRHEKSIVPLDGQQRLTTLFLLAWILKYRQTEKDIESFKLDSAFDNLMKGLNSFCYKTRPSSGAFCTAIVNEQILPSSGSISEVIHNQSWFGDDWKKDPSVSAMLQMLDVMEKMLEGKNVSRMFRNLLNGDGISFELLDMQDYKLTDGLYIKMNARGKQLTEFENWKSEFIGFLEDHHSREVYGGTISQEILQNVFDNNQPTLKEYFAHSIEHQWTDLFWKYCIEEINLHQQELQNNSNPSKRDKDCYPVIDKYFMRVFEKMTQIFFYVKDPSRKTATDYKPSKETRNDIYSDKNYVDELFGFLDLLCSFDDDKFNELFYSTTSDQNTFQSGKVRLFDNNETNLLSRCAKDINSTETSNVLLYALLRYAEVFGTTVDNDMKYYIRSVRNQIESKQYLLTKDVRMVNDFNIYDIVSKGILDEIDKLINAKKTGASWTITNFEAAIEDFSFICGNMRFKVTSGTPAHVYEVLKAWDAMQHLEKVQLLISYGFKGHFIMPCGHGELYFFGLDGKWKPIFVHNDSKGNGGVDQALNNIVSDYLSLPTIIKGGHGLEELLKQRKANTSIFNFIYYVLHYDSFMAAHAHGKNPYYYFSIQGPIDKINIAAMQYSGRPTMAYHTDPIVYTVKKQLQSLVDDNSQTLYLGYSITGANRACLYVYDKLWDDKNPIAVLRHKDGLHGTGGWEQLDGSTNAVIASSKDKPNVDRVEDGIAFIKSLYPNATFEEKG